MNGNHGGVAYVSYAREDDKQHGIIAELEQAFEGKWVSLQVDKNEVKTRESFDTFIKEIGAADCVILSLSDHYFESFYCMLELAYVFETGEVDQRTYPIFPDENYRFDGSRRKWKAHWEQKKVEWHESPPETTEEYGTLDECELILKHLEAIFDQFERELAGCPKTNGSDIVKLVEERFTSRVRESGAFTNAINHLNSCDKNTQECLLLSINNFRDESISDSTEDQIAFLSSLPIPKLIELINEARETIENRQLQSTQAKCFSELSQILKHLLPALFSPAYVSKLRDECEEISFIEIPFATELSAEILMAGVDGRSPDFKVTQRSEINPKPRLHPGIYRLRLPPEVADGDITRPTEDDLFRRMGIQDRQVTDILSGVEDHFAFNFADLERTGSYTIEQKRKLAQIGLADLKEDGEPRYYWILGKSGSVGGSRWEEFTTFINTHYPEIVLLVLDGDFDKNVDEVNLFKSLHKTLATDH